MRINPILYPVLYDLTSINSGPIYQFFSRDFNKKNLKMKLLNSIVVASVSASTATPMESTAPPSTAEYSLEAMKM